MALEDVLLEFFETAHLANAGKNHVIGKAVNVGEKFCDVEREGEPTIFDVRFHCIEDEVENKIVIIPKEGSQVMCGYIESKSEKEQNEAFIEQCSEIQEVMVKTGDKVYKINDQGHLIKGGTDTLKQVIQLMIEGSKLIIEATQEILVIYGNNPDYGKLLQANTDKFTQALNKMNNILT